MKSGWTIVIAFAAAVAGAFWYDARVTADVRAATAAFPR
jgi:hypothetical protein